ncbi:MAG TPA: hypothetical protein VG318_07355 [Actinomycetota bacterium]|nr:hypothetical protein [Actinomycetota bacterium]
MEQLTAIYAGALEELRGLKEPGQDEAYDEWLAAWQEYVDLGPRFADALRTGDPEVYEAVGDEGDEPARTMNAIARENEMNACVF